MVLSTDLCCGYCFVTVPWVGLQCEIVAVLVIPTYFWELNFWVNIYMYGCFLRKQVCQNCFFAIKKIMQNIFPADFFEFCFYR